MTDIGTAVGEDVPVTLTGATTVRSAIRAEKPVNFWDKTAPNYTLGADRWRIYIRRGDGKSTLRVDDAMESLTWDDASAVRTGTLAVRRPANGPKLEVTEGSQVIVQWSHAGGPFKELWRMRLTEPNSTASDGSVSYQLIDDLQYLQLGSEDFHYAKDKQHPNGWLVHEIVADICKRFGVGVGRMIKTTTRVKRMTKRCSPLEAIVFALRKEKVATGRHMVISSSGGKVNVDPLRRSKYLLLMGKKLGEAAYTRQVLKEGFATSITVHGSRKVKGHNKHLSVTVTSKNGVKRYGTVHRFVSGGDADTVAEATKVGKRVLAKAMLPKQTLTLTMQGIPGLRRGAALLVDLPDEGVRQVVYVTEVRHSVSGGGDYTMDVEVRFTDPYTSIDKSSKKKVETKRASIRAGETVGSAAG